MRCVLKMSAVNTASIAELEMEYEECSKKLRLGELYDIEISSIEASENGAGGLTYFVSAGNRKYVVKYASDNEMDHPEVEIRVCEKLYTLGIL